MLLTKGKVLIIEVGLSMTPPKDNQILDYNNLDNSSNKDSKPNQEVILIIANKAKELYK